MENAHITEEARPSLKETLLERSKEVKELLTPILENLSEPTTVAELARMVKANRATIQKIVVRSIEKEGNPYNLACKKLGTYDTIYKRLSVKEKIEDEPHDGEENASNNSP